MRLPVHIALAAFVVALPTQPSAWAQTAPRAWVSGHGTDAAGCSAPTNPCRSFQYAHDHVVVAGGEIDVLDPGGYGAIVIGKSISIVNDGVGEAGVQALGGGIGIDIHAGPNDVINLRGLTIAGNNLGNEGVFMDSGAALNVQNCVIRDFISDGIGVQPPADLIVHVQDTVLTNDRNNAIGFQPSGAGRVTGFLARVFVTGAGSGIFVNGSNTTGGALSVTIEDSAFGDNFWGISAAGSMASGPTKVLVVGSTISNNKTDGLFDEEANSTIFLARSALSGNATAFAVSLGGLIDSFGDNYIVGNGADGGALPLVSAK